MPKRMIGTRIQNVAWSEAVRGRAPLNDRPNAESSRGNNARASGAIIFSGLFSIGQYRSLDRRSMELKRVKPALVERCIQGGVSWIGVKFGWVPWSAIGGAIVLAFVGFNYGGWVTGGTAAAMAKQIAADTVAERLGSICVAQFNQDADKDQKLKEMTGKDSWDMGRYIEKQRWAIMPGEEKSDSTVADSCAKLLAAKA